MARARPRRLGLALRAGSAVGLALALFYGSPAASQIVFDDTFGQPGAAPTANGGALHVIEESRGGLVSGSGRTHLFHSFERFDVPVSQGAEFRASDVVDTVLARVTGGGASSIAGGIRVRNTSGIGGPDLVLINPNGVLFSDNVRLDMDGAFTVAGADAVGFADGAEFSAIDLSAPLPTTAAEPSVLVFGAPDPTRAGFVELGGRIFSNDAGGARDVAALTIVGRDVRTTGTGFVAAEQATVQIGAVGGTALDVPFDLATVDARGGETTTGTIAIGGAGDLFNVSTVGPNPDQGRIVIRGGELVLENAGLVAGGDGASSTLAVDVEVAGTIRVDGSSAKIEALAGGTVAPGGIRIRAAALELMNAGSVESTNNGAGDSPGTIDVAVDRLLADGPFSQVKSTARGEGAGAAIAIHATDRVSLVDRAHVFSETLESAPLDVGQGGDITIEAPLVSLVDDAQVLSVTNDAGDAGRIDVVADQLSIEGGAQVLSVTNGAGQGGDIMIDSSLASIVDDAQVLSVTNDAGDAGRIDVSANQLALRRGFIRSGSNSTARGGDVSIEAGHAILSESALIGTGDAIRDPDNPDPLGPGGDLEVTAETLTLLGGSQITTTTNSAFDAGDLDVRVDGLLRVAGEAPNASQPSGLFSRSGRQFGAGATGDGGTLTVRAGRLEVGPRGEIGVRTTGTGGAGRLTVDVAGDLEVAGGALTARSTGQGRTSDLVVRAGGDVLVSEGGTIRSDAPLPSAGNGGGSIVIESGGTLRLIDGTITTESARPASGNVTLRAAEVVSVVGGSVATDVDFADGSGGDIVVEARSLVLADGILRANATQNNAVAGNIRIVAPEGIVRSAASTIEATNDLGISGAIVLNGPVTNLGGELSALATAYRETSEALDDPCRARESRAGSFEIRPLAEGASVANSDALPPSELPSCLVP